MSYYVKCFEFSYGGTVYCVKFLGKIGLKYFNSKPVMWYAVSYVKCVFDRNLVG